MSAKDGGYQQLLATDDDAVLRQTSARSIATTGSMEIPEDVVQFIESVAVVNSDEGTLSVGIMRIGRCFGTCKCTWKTVEGSAKPGKQYKTSSGVIEMKDGENSAFLEVPIICDPRWNATKEFRILLENPENCTLGLYLKVLRVKMVDANVFPSNEFRSQVPPMSPSMAEDISELGLFIGFIKLMWYQDGVQWRTVLQVFFGVLHNLYEYMSLIVSVYLVDKVFNFKDDDKTLFFPGNRLLTAYVIGLALFLPRVLFFCLKHAENYLDLNGRMRSELSKSLFRKFMNYSSRSRDEVPLPDMVNSLTQDLDSVSRGYTRVLHMCRTAGSIVIAIFFTLQQNPGVWWAVVAVPCIMGFWIKVRTRVFIEASEANDEKESNLLAFSNMSLSKMTLIGAYRQRPQMNDYFEEKVQDLQNTAVSTKSVTVNNEGVPTLLGPTLVALYTLIGATLVLNHELGLGTYLATIKVFESICNSFSELYEVMMSIISTFPVLKGLTQLLNMETELPSMKAAAKKTAAMTLTKRKEMPDGDVPRVDRMEIQVCEITFEYTDNDNKPTKRIFKNFSATAAQGSIVGLHALSGGGRKTLLDLMAGTIYPTSGLIFIPSHLRTLLLSREIFILDLSIWANLTFGNKAGNNPHRVEKILNHFDMHVILDDKQFQRDLQKRKAEFDGSAGATAEEEEEEVVASTNVMLKFREADQALLHLVRGFIMNPEVMLMHRPFVHFHDEAICEKIETALTEQRDNRGFQMPAKSRLTRRPRTAFMSCDSPSHWKIADLVWELPKEYGGAAKSRASFREHMEEYMTNSQMSQMNNPPDLLSGTTLRPDNNEASHMVAPIAALPETNLDAILRESLESAPQLRANVPAVQPPPIAPTSFIAATSNGPNKWDI